MANISHVTATLPQGKPATAEELEATKNQPKFEISTVEYRGRHSTVEERSQLARQEFQAFTNISKITQSMGDRLSKAIKAVESEIPSLENKHWDFSLDEQNGLVVIGDNLSDSEAVSIKSILEESNIIRDLATFRDNLVNAFDFQRGHELYTEKAARFNLEMGTFEDIFRFKEFSEATHDESNPLSHLLAEENIFSQVSARGEEKYNQYTMTTFV